jgi:threonine/homoserine/homoserine lactone efflux protein
MSLELLATFAAASAVLLTVPGPTALALVSYSLARGRTVRAPLIAAVVAGDATALGVSLLGLGALLATSATWFSVLKWAGGLYLLYLGARFFRAGAEPAAPSVPDEPAPLWRAMSDLYLVTALNPKGIVFFVAFLPQFVSPDGDPVRQLWVLSTVYLTLGLLTAALYVAFAAALRRLLRPPRARRRFHTAGGALLLAAGAWALLARRPP